MRFLVDSCISFAVCQILREHGDEVEWVPEVFNGDPGDEAVYHR
jgi:predicted nuclease of predicted toxin-antitoxin system